MNPAAEPMLFCWSGGKDSAMALTAIRKRGDCRVTALLTTVTEGYDRISMHGVRRELLEWQAEAIGLPLRKVLIPPDCVNATYEARMREALEEQHVKGVRRVVFGDIFLEDLRVYREKNLALIGMTGVFPLWKQDTRELARRFVNEGFRAVAACVDSRVLPRGFAGRELDNSFFADLPPGVDPCGENGEFHTFVFDGPVFRTPLSVARGEVVERGPFIYCDLMPVRTEKTLGCVS
ncbi:MAG TPA: diphthine--ammonia ligase [Candidatus Acidoferrales bacterium]|nr:diphthine--ammonia ligase [Candidatus Acidoferrales bacterium]